MTLLINSPAVQPGTHVLAVGVGTYTHLPGGAGPVADRPLGLRQLASPPVSLKAVVDWFLAPVLDLAAPGFVNPLVPLGSVEALASAEAPVAITTATGEVSLAQASRQNIQQAFEDWLGRVQSHPENIGVFYFCGHGLMAENHFLLADDFGQSRAMPWANAFDITATIRAVERKAAGAIYYFIDACRDISRDMAMTLGADPHALMAVELDNKVIGRSITAVYAAGEGQLAHAPPGPQVSRFTRALLGALSGYCGIKGPGQTSWGVDGETIAVAIRQLLVYDALDNPGGPGDQQVSEQTISGTPIPLMWNTQVPRVKVLLDLAPTQRRAAYELYLESAAGDRVAQKQLNSVFKADVPRGFYEVGALDPLGNFPAIQHHEQELMPPMFPLVLQSRP